MRHMTQRSIQMEDEPRPLAWPSSSPPEFTIPSETRSSVGYIVSTWPSLSQTFVLNEVLALERRGLQLRIFSTKEPKDEPVHADAGRVHAKVSYLALHRRWKPILQGNLRTLWRQPGAYSRTLLRAVLRPRWSFFRNLLQAGYLADLLSGEPVAHLHAHLASAPASVTMLAHHLTGIPYTFTAHAKDIYFDAQPALMRAKMMHAKGVVTVSEYNRRHLISLLEPAARNKVHCVYNGADLSQYKYRPSGEKRTGFPVVLSVARHTSARPYSLCLVWSLRAAIATVFPPCCWKPWPAECRLFLRQSPEFRNSSNPVAMGCLCRRETRRCSRSDLA